MDITLLSTLLGATIALVTSFVTTLWTQQTLQRQEEKKKYQEKIEEIQELALKVNAWLDFEFEGWWFAVEYNSTRTNNKLECPIEKLTMLAERYEPSLNQSITVITDIIAVLKQSDLEMGEEGSDEDYYFRTRIVDCSKRFSTAKSEMRSIFKCVNEKYSKSAVKVKITAPTEN